MEPILKLNAFNTSSRDNTLRERDEDFFGLKKDFEETTEDKNTRAFKKRQLEKAKRDAALKQRTKKQLPQGYIPEIQAIEPENFQPDSAFFESDIVTKRSEIRALENFEQRD